MYPKAYIDYLVYFHGQRDYFECHEVLEEHWKREEPENRNKHWVGLIQLAVALYHQRRQNWRGAERMMRSALHLLRNEKDGIVKLSLDFNNLVFLLENRLNEIKEKTPYTSLTLPVTDPGLIDKCKEVCEEKGCQWNVDSNMKDEYLLHKHRMRDRSDILNERFRQKELRQQKRKGT
ncbi:DUF309 domain-containing protein [Pseudalkalibacillus caeni]|uniref:DUF309 domain-containing protein n=1 Tax=Exobacillus caeni TaxID=2574798 RepID=A0A5R9F453_9BACL|nr:DUF309 domain-containing protein [Pseudalkalibacillus caeni]TLS35643.1 DUF309 domain-containing protein [Pseudalkalibacillus caeni]